MATPLERVQAAWATGDPLALHRDVEQMAAEGYSQQVLEDALEALLREARSNGADDETEEIINDVWDRLTGWCHESCSISTLPRKESGAAADSLVNGKIMPEQLSDPSRLA
jgi:hypothetical protein